MEIPTFILPLATDVLLATTLKQSIIVGKLETAAERSNMYDVLRAIADEISRALADLTSSKRTARISIDSVLLTGPYFHLATDHLTAQGYTFTINPDSLTVYW
jgi:hypothetical protein